MADHSSHKLNAYINSDRTKTVFCRVCSSEGSLLEEPCPGKFVSEDKSNPQVNDKKTA